MTMANPFQGPSKEQIAINRHLVDCNTVDDVFQLLRELNESGQELSLVNCCTALYKLARTTGRASTARIRQLTEDPTYIRLASTAQRFIADQPASADLRSLASLAWSLARLGAPADGPLLASILLHAVSRNLSTAQPATLCSLANAAAHPPRQAAPALRARASAPRAGDAVDRAAQRSMLTAVAEEVARRGAAGLSSQDLSGLLTSFGRARLCSSPALAILATEILRRAAAPAPAAPPHAVGEPPAAGGGALAAFSPQAIATSLWGLARLAGGGGAAAAAARQTASAAELDTARRAVAALVGEAARRALRGFTSQEVSMTLWAAATVPGLAAAGPDGATAGEAGAGGGGGVDVGALLEAVEDWTGRGDFALPQARVAQERQR